MHTDRNLIENLSAHFLLVARQIELADGSIFSGISVMAQIKIYGHAQHRNTHRAGISDAIHSCAVAELGLPEEKRFHRFIPLAPEDFIHPADRSEAYTIIEVSLF